MINPVHHIHAVIKQIAATPKTKEKEFLLSELLHPHNPYAELAFEIMRRTYCNRVVYGISHLPIEYCDPLIPRIPMPITEVFQYLDNVTSRNITGNAAVDLLVGAMRNTDRQTADLLQWMVNKDMRAGFGPTLINKVSKVRQIEEVPYMRCQLANNVGMGDWAEWKNGDGVYLQLKADGMFQRCNIDKTGAGFVSRQGEIMPNVVLRNISKALEHAYRVAGYTGRIRLDGELTMQDPYTNETMKRADSNGEFNSCRQNSEAVAKDTRIVYSLWDLVMEDGPAISYEARIAQTSAMVAAAREWLKENDPDNIDVIELIESERVYSLDDAIAKCQAYMLAGKEGAVAKKPGLMFKDGTSNDQVKMKIDFDFEAKIVGYVEGKPGKKTAATFGSLLWESSDGIVRGAASGISDKDRERINADREGFLGTIITIRGNDLTQNRDEPDFWAVSHPRVEEFRTDKIEADNYDTVRANFELAKRFQMPEGKKAKKKK